MATANTEAKIFLVQPLNKKKYKEMIVYSDTEEQARKAASKADNPAKIAPPGFPNLPDPVYLNQGMSICIHTEADVLNVDHQTDTAKVKYNEVIYELKKNKAEPVIAEDIL